MKKKVKKMVREESLEEDLSFFNVLRIRFPTAFVWLKIFPMARRKCIICRDPEPLFAKNVAGMLRKIYTNRYKNSCKQTVQEFLNWYRNFYTNYYMFFSSHLSVAARGLRI